MGILRSMFKNLPSPPIQCCEPIRWLDARFAPCLSPLLRGSRGKTSEIVQIAVFPIIFVTDCLKNLKNFKCAILQLVVFNHFEGVQLPIKSL